MDNERVTYETAGVNLQSSEKIKDKIKELAKETYNSSVIGGVGGFGAMYKISGYREPILVSSTDPVGTKLMVAGMIGDYSFIGEDLVNACINDLIKKTNFIGTGIHELISTIKGNYFRAPATG